MSVFAGKKANRESERMKGIYTYRERMNEKEIKYEKMGYKRM